MQDVSALYNTIIANDNYIVETKIVIAGTTYTEEEIISMSTRRNLYNGSTAAIGGCVSSEINVAIIPSGTIPRMAEMRPYVRLVLGSQTSEWIPKGVYYIDTRETDALSGVMSIHGYDAMLKAEVRYLPEDDTDVDDWPQSMAMVVSDIAENIIGVNIDERTYINPAYMVEYPNDYTAREILGYIAAAHGGNWTITDAGELRLIGLTDVPEDTSILSTEDGYGILFGEVRILV